MSLVTQIIYNALDTVKEECKKHEKCVECPFNETRCADAPCEWNVTDMENITNIIYEKYHK